ncbi:hypothetical protein DIS24_g9474 [Lasiodiplodia hormozganensis]|uniref:Uncharacterized protein n=1 Tax=Lasiodiplodia hormozganensis TaxID=869390 RepID=A0AA39XWG1_9PEZI|nr:hypothetical protein DIS24_g9474 [Lasiodiplodia hormozganensis]
MGDAIKRLFHRRNWSADKESHLQSLSYRDATPGTPPRRGSLPLRGDVVLTANRPHNTPVYSASPTRICRPASLGSSHRGRVHRNRLRRAMSDASRRGRAENLWKTENGDVRNSEEMSHPPLPGTAVSSDHARCGNARLAARQSSAGSESYYDEDVAESFPNPPPASTATRNRSSYPAPLSVPSKGLNPRDTASYSLDEEASPLSDQSRANNTQSRLFLDNSSDEESLRESSRERTKRDSRGSLRRKRAYSSGLRDFTDPTNRLSVQEPVDTAEGIPDGYPERSAQSYLIDSSPEPSSLEGIVDLRNTEDVAYHTRPTTRDDTIEPRRFTARDFPGTEGNEVRYTTKDGFERTETTWIHAPTIETYMRSPGEHEGADSEPHAQDLAGGVRDAPFDECAEYEAASERMKSLHIKSDSGVGRMRGDSE